MATPLQQKTLDFGKPAGLRDRPVNQAAAQRTPVQQTPVVQQTSVVQQTPEGKIAWHFCDPKGRRLDNRLGANTPASRPPHLPGGAAPPSTGNEKTQKQVSALLNLMSRGKRRAAPAAPRQAPEQDVASTLLDCLHQPTRGGGLRGAEPSHSRSGGDDDGTNELLDSLVQIAEESSQSQAVGSNSSPPAAAPVGAAPAPAPAAAPPAAEDDEDVVPTQQSLPRGPDLGAPPVAAAPVDAPAESYRGPAPAAPAEPDAGMPAAAAPKRGSAIAEPLRAAAQPPMPEALGAGAPPMLDVAPPVPEAAPAPPATPAPDTMRDAPPAAESPLPAALSASSDGCRNLERHPPRVTSGVVLEKTCTPEVTLLRLRLDESAAPPQLEGGGDAPPAAPELQVSLRDGWHLTPVRAGDRVHLVGEIGGGASAHGAPAGAGGAPPLPPPPAEVALTRESGPLLVLRPETVVTGTALAAACKCERRAVLGRQRKDDERGGWQMTLGTMKHAVFEAQLHAWQQGGPEPEWGSVIDGVVGAQLAELAALGKSDCEAREELRRLVPVVQRWAATFLPRAGGAAAPPPPPPAPLPEPDDHHTRLRAARAFEAAGLPAAPLRVARVMATEQQLVSHTYGLKGTLDVVLAADVLAAGPDAPSTHSVPVPLELKTGRRTPYNQNEHMAQVLVYSLLLGERHSCRVPSGVLYYTQLSDTDGRRGLVPTPADAGMLADLLKIRNAMAAGCAPHAAADGRMPAMIHSPQECRFCPELLHCTLTHRAVEGGDARSSGIEALFEQHTAVRRKGALRTPHRRRLPRPPAHPDPCRSHMGGRAPCGAAPERGAPRLLPPLAAAHRLGGARLRAARHRAAQPLRRGARRRRPLLRRHAAAGH